MRTIALIAMLFLAGSSADAQQRRPDSDWPWLSRYRVENAALIASKARPDIVFMGDSITEGWIARAPGFFSAGRVDRGISGQTTPQMLLRFRADVIALRPRAVHIMAGTNDIAGNTGPMTLAETEANIMSMAELARAHGIAVVIASIPPADRFSWKPAVEPAPQIAEFNRWAREYARQTGAVYADYWSVLRDGDAMRTDFSADGVHPNPSGYAAMAPVAEAAIRTALRR